MWLETFSRYYGLCVVVAERGAEVAGENICVALSFSFFLGLQSTAEPLKSESKKSGPSVAKWI
jgi:hypothetical protein